MKYGSGMHAMLIQSIEVEKRGIDALDIARFLHAARLGPLSRRSFIGQGAFQRNIAGGRRRDHRPAAAAGAHEAVMIDQDGAVVDFDDHVGTLLI